MNKDVLQIMTDIKTLSHKDKLDVLSHIVELLKRPDSSSNQRSITELKGLGKELWRKYDIEEYIRESRE